MSLPPLSPGVRVCVFLSRIQAWYKGCVDRAMVEDLKLERAEEAIQRQNLEDDVVDLAGA